MAQDAAQILRDWTCVESGPFFEEDPDSVEFLAEMLPAETFRLLEEFGGREGFIGKCYLRLFRLEELMALNTAYGIPDHSPYLLIFASVGCGYAYAFAGREAVIQIPFIPLDIDQAEIVAEDFPQLILDMDASGPTGVLDPELVGKEVHHRQPIAFGGAGADPENIIYPPQAKHAELVKFWNKVYFERKGRASPGT
jgi:hypothetical protein